MPFHSIYSEEYILTTKKTHLLNQMYLIDFPF